MKDSTVVTKQTYLLTGNKKTNGTFKVELVDVIDENSSECVCREFINGEKHFNIVVKNKDGKVNGQEMADMVEANKYVMGVDYLKSDDERGVYFVRYLEGDHTEKAALSNLFIAVEERMRKNAMFRGWTISEKGVLLAKKAEYFY